MANNQRLTQEVVEVQETAITYAGGNTVRLTQEVVEVQESVSYAGGNTARLTQIAVEVQITNPVDVFPEVPFLEDIIVSAAELAGDLGIEAVIVQESYFGPHVRILQLGVRRQWLKMLRR